MRGILAVLFCVVRRYPDLPIPSEEHAHQVVNLSRSSTLHNPVSSLTPTIIQDSFPNL